jgi:hypothetical protein
LLGGDTRIVELLFGEDRCVVATGPEWKQLVGRRNEFLTKAVLNKYLKEVKGSKGIKLIEKMEARLSEEVWTEPSSKEEWVCS